MFWNGVKSDVTYQLEVLLGNFQVLPGPILLEDETFCDLNYHQRRTQGPFHSEFSLKMIFCDLNYHQFFVTSHTYSAGCKDWWYLRSLAKKTMDWATFYHHHQILSPGPLQRWQLPSECILEAQLARGPLRMAFMLEMMPTSIKIRSGILIWHICDDLKATNTLIRLYASLTSSWRR